MLKKVKVGKNTKECFAEMSEIERCKMDWGVRWCNWIPQNCRTAYKNSDTGSARPRSTKSWNITVSRVLFSFACPPLDHGLSLEETQILQFLHHWFRHFAFAPTSWKIGNCFIFNLGFVLFGSHLNITSLGSGATKGAMDGTGSEQVWIWIRRRPGVQRVKPSQVTRRIYMVSGGNFVNIWEINGFFTFQESFHYLFCHEFSLILKSKWRDLNSRLGGYGICVSEIYFSNFLENNEAKDWSDPQPDSTIQPKAWGLLHIEREYFAHQI